MSSTKVAKGCVGGGTTGKEGEGELEMVGRICRSQLDCWPKKAGKRGTQQIEREGEETRFGEFENLA